MLLLCPALSVQAGEPEFAFEVPDPSFTESPFSARFGGQLATTFWSTTDPAAALNKSTGSYLDPRATFFIDASAYDHLYFHATARIDQGFDPLNEENFELRLDEYFLRYTPFESNSLRIQVGKFATVFGSWVGQHDQFDTPFISPPLPYSQIVGLNIRNPAGLSAQAIANRANGIAPGVYETPKSLWASTIWGPSYGSGISLSGQSAHLDYAFEMKNIPLSEHAADWDNGFDRLAHPTFSGRLGYRPNASLAFGFSASHGPYLAPDSESLLPAGTEISDLPYTTLGADLRWSGGPFIFTGEIIASEYETLEDLALRSLSYYGEFRWKMNPSLFLAARWGQSFHNEIDAPNGESVRWSPDLWRLGASVGWRATPDLLIKSEYSFTSIDESGTDGQHLLGLNATWRF